VRCDQTPVLQRGGEQQDEEPTMFQTVPQLDFCCADGRRRLDSELPRSGRPAWDPRLDGYRIVMAVTTTPDENASESSEVLGRGRSVHFIDPLTDRLLQGD
jgi:hypothetical protein